MFDCERTQLWTRTLGEREADPDRAAREYLREHLRRLRERAGLAAEQIRNAYPSFGWVRRGNRFDVLWERVDLLLGPSYPLTAAEAFVLGSALLVQELGVGLAGMPGGEAGLRATQEWKDALAARIHQETDRAPSPAELKNPAEEYILLAMEDALRVLALKRARSLALFSWQGPRGEALHLLEDEGLRRHFGELVGELAYSQEWDVAEVGRVLAQRTLAAPASLPADWTVDGLKVAAVLRAARTLLVEERRRRLSRPTLVQDRLLYTTGEPFSRGESEVFWTCFDALRVIDRELRDVDALLRASGRPRLMAQGVVDVDDASRLASHLKTQDWIPVDARVHLSEVPGLLAQLGGAALYRKDPSVPLRELIQNAADAIRARRVLEGRDAEWGTITVRVGRDSHGRWIEVADTGLGMTERVLTRHLLDVGRSYWMSEEMRRDHPGLSSSGFHPTGRFGVGFFSVFMWGDRLRVASRPLKGQATQVLEFDNGLGAHPILRPAQRGEPLDEAGTCIRVWLAREQDWEQMLLDRSDQWDHWSESEERITFGELLGRVCPTLDVTLELEERPGQAVTVLKANDWLTLESTRLLRRIGNTARGVNTALMEFLAPMVRPVMAENGQCVGRICIASGSMQRWAGMSVLTAGGMRARYSREFTGALLATTDVVTRDDAEPLAMREDLARWASEQARLWEKYQLNFEGYELHKRLDIGLAVLSCGGEPGELPIGYRAGTSLTLATLQEFVAERDEVTLVDGAERAVRKHAELVVIPCHEAGHAAAGRLLAHLPELIGVYLAKAWGASIQEVVDNVQIFEKEWNPTDGRKRRTWVFQRPEVPRFH
ncbi:Histidine kinase-, DNA gyrase B-, and HSP90-like ATPase [Stigmatella aurantiaca]|uniref:Histidine kinase-, DNA gyrase B-, and HSP90-like ATPase n=1 Tax=Stigmatella aurantiaca TaxID=41 RepID=A0A1H7G2T5_STIAU|nr:ATP-binding protein [Stigmatella aurantiaca]SEK32364.1 Histidine kinase-, DNA gyrase B-, and HSP90-like ATPase [Stigmatella aurantiaca]